MPIHPPAIRMSGHSPAELATSVGNAHGILLDFDGPSAHVFAGLPAPLVAERLRGALHAGGADLPEENEATDNPVRLAHYSVTLGPDTAQRIDALFRALEVTAAERALPSPHAHDVIHACKASGRRVGIVTNNAEEAVRTYLDRHGLTASLDAIAARPVAKAELMKPDPHLVRQAVQDLDLTPERCLMVGDSRSDMTASIAADVPCVGYTNKPEKARRLAKKTPRPSSPRWQR